MLCSSSGTILLQPWDGTGTQKGTATPTGTDSDYPTSDHRDSGNGRGTTKEEKEESKENQVVRNRLIKTLYVMRVYETSTGIRVGDAVNEPQEKVMSIHTKKKSNCILFYLPMLYFFDFENNI